MTRYIPFDSFLIFLLGFYLQEKGDIAFLNENTVLDYANNTNDFELLCPAKTGDPTLTLSSSPYRSIQNPNHVSHLNIHLSYKINQTVLSSE